MEQLAQQLMVSTEHEVWERSFAVTRKPKHGNRLAIQILDTKYFRDFWSFCQLLAKSYTKATQIFVAPDEIEGILRMWADSANFAPESDLESALFPALDFYSREFEGWTPSQEASIDLLPFLDGPDSE